MSEEKELIAIPFRVSDDYFSVFVVLRNENLRRIVQYDPAEIAMWKFPGDFQGLRLKDVIIGFATEAEVKDLMDAVPLWPDQLKAKLKHLSRGWKFRPDRGDNDDPYERIKKE